MACREFGSLALKPSSSELIEQLLKLILDMDDSERAFVPFSPSDDLLTKLSCD
jgi:hypothetical protein